MTKILLTFSFLFAAVILKAQDQVAKPQIVNYNNEQYNAGLQNWDVRQGSDGILYFGNNEGLLTFNGNFWNLYRLPNRTAVRSLGIDFKNRVFVGGQDQLGYFYPDHQGRLKYHSLLPLVPVQYREFADIWNISILNDEVFFRTKRIILHYKDGIIKTYLPNSSWEFLGQANHQIFAHDKDTGLMVYDKEVWKPYCNDPSLKESAVTAIMEYNKDTLLVSTLKNGMFLLTKNRLVRKKTSLDQVFYNDRIYYAGRINKEEYAIGTTSGGVLIIDNRGKLIQKYIYTTGLQNNNVRGIWIDHNKNMWLALDDGIDFIAINSAIKFISPDKSKQTTSYAFRKFNGVLYIGTSNGLYASALSPGVHDLSLSKADFREVKNTKGQIWNLDEINNQLIIGHEDGCTIIKNGVARQLYSIPGTWMFQPMSNVFPTHEIIAGTYLGLRKIGFSNDAFTKLEKIEGTEESLRFIIADSNNNIWASHPYHGVYKIELYPGYQQIKKTTLYTKKDGLPSSLYNYVYKVRNRIMVATENGIYEFDSATNRFRPGQLLRKALTGMSVQYLKEDADKNIWFVSNKKVGVIDFSKQHGVNPFSVYYLPELDGKVVGGFESIYVPDRENVFIGANKGAYHINYKKYIGNITRPDILLGTIRLSGGKDSVLFGGYFMRNDTISSKQDLSQIPVLSYEFNSVQFEFSSTLFEHKKNITYSYQLQGFDKSWSSWTNKAEKQYTNLPAGSYTFHVKARTSADSQSKVVSYTFQVLPPWYQTIWMYLLYFIILLVILYLFFRKQKKKHKSEQARLSYLHQLEMDKREQEIIRLQYEKLETEVTYKNRELATITMHLNQKGRVLAKIKDVISTVIKNRENDGTLSNFRHLVRLIRDVEKGDQDLDHLTIHFNNVNTEFFNKLKDRFPDITPNELKLSAYLKMNISSKEIAQLMNITIKAVEVGRYRLRKKLKLQPEVNLYEFLIQVSRSQN